MTRRLSKWEAETDDKEDPSITVSAHGWNGPRIIMSLLICIFGGGGSAVAWKSRVEVQNEWADRRKSDEAFQREVRTRLSTIERDVAVLRTRFDAKLGGSPMSYPAPSLAAIPAKRDGS